MHDEQRSTLIPLGLPTAPGETGPTDRLLSQPLSIRLQLAALSVAAIPISLLVALLSDDPWGWFGAAQSLTTSGLVTMLVLSIVAALGGVLQAVGLRGARTALMLGFGGLAAVSLPLSVGDPAVGLPALSWYVWIAFRFFFRRLQYEPGEAPRLSRGQEFYLAELSMSVVAVLLTIVTIGYRFVSSNVVAGLVLWCCVMALGLSIVTDVGRWREQWKTAGFWAPWMIMALVLVFAGVSPMGIGAAIAARQLARLAWHAVAHSSTQRALDYLFAHPAQLVSVSFAVTILLGALVLSFPICSVTGASMGGLNALFMATSAVCVTGLVVVDTATELSMVGQAMILLLIQIGGLGVITLSSFGAMLISKRLGLKQEGALGELIDQPRPRELYSLVRLIVISTFAFELLGMLALYAGFRGAGEQGTQALWKAIFHSISAFCNAGFALQTTSLMPYHDKPLVLLPVTALVIVGGIGFPVIASLLGKVLYRRRISLHARLSLHVTWILIAVGFLGFVLLEWSHSFQGQTTGSKLLSALFQSITLRTAGFNSVDMAQMQGATIAFMMAWMFIGGGSGSTAGGIKTTTFAILVLQVGSLIRGRESIQVLGRAVPPAITQRAIAVVVLFSSFIALGHLLLLATQRGEFEALLFETVSAMGTVGLSLGSTGQLDGLGKVVVVLLMYAGRLGPLTLLLTMRAEALSKMRFPPETVSVG